MLIRGKRVILDHDLANIKTDRAWRSTHSAVCIYSYAFTQEGVAMLSSVLRSEKAILVNVAIMRAFVRLKEMIAENSELKRRLDELERKYDGQFKSVFAAIRELMSVHAVPRKRIIGLDDPA